MTQKYEMNKIFNSIDFKHQIEISIIDNISWFSIKKINYESYKTFLLLLKEMMEYLGANNIVYVRHYVYEEDLEYLKNSSYVEINESQYVVTTNITHFLSEIISVLGIQKL